MALSIFDLSALHMHGPEYHSIVTAVLIAAYGNYKKNKDPSAIKEAILRGKAIFGGICGTHGACGTCIGAGIAYSLIHKVTPFSNKHRGEANRMTALALTEVGKYGGPRCCKREAITSIEIAKKYFNGFPAVAKSRYICSQSARNKTCLKSACPYYPNKRIGLKKCT